jgi:hypothetical protein
MSTRDWLDLLGATMGLLALIAGFELAAAQRRKKGRR